MLRRFGRLFPDEDPGFWVTTGLTTPFSPEFQTIMANFLIETQLTAVILTFPTSGQIKYTLVSNVLTTTTLTSYVNWYGLDRANMNLDSCVNANTASTVNGAMYYTRLLRNPDGQARYLTLYYAPTVFTP